MKKVKIYSFEVCPYCVQAKAMLNAMGVEFSEEVVTREQLADLTAKSGMLTVPQIFVGEELIGGFTELQASVKSGEFQQKLAQE